MHVVRRDDGDEIHALVCGQFRFGFDHLLKRAVATIRWKKEIRAAGFAAFRIGGKRAANEFNLLIHRRCNAMHRADESSASAADHAVTNFSAHNYSNESKGLKSVMRTLY